MPQGWTPVAEQSAAWTPVESAPSYPRDAAGRPLDARGRPLQDVVGDGNAEPSHLLEMLGPLAHPETFTDFARLLTLPVDSVRRAAVSALALAKARPTASAGLTKTGEV